MRSSWYGWGVTLPFFCVLAAFLLAYLPKIPLSMAMAKAPGGYDNREPRTQQQALTGWGRRALAAHQNAFEAFPPFAASVMVAHLAHASAGVSSALALTHVAARTIYPVLYLANVATLRSLVWGVGFVATAGLFLAPLFS